jgi:predicted transcriptional regulator
MNPKEHSLTHIFIKEKPVMTVLSIHKSRSETYPSKISQKIDSTYSHTINIISELEENGIVETKKEGRKRLVKLTDKGKEYAEILEKLVDMEEGGPDLEPDSSLYFLRNQGEK